VAKQIIFLETMTDFNLGARLTTKCLLQKLCICKVEQFETLKILGSSFKLGIDVIAIKDRKIISSKFDAF